MVMEGVNQVGGECCAHVIDVSPPNRDGVWKVDSSSCSMSSITRFATNTDTGDPISMPWIRRYTFPSNLPPTNIHPQEAKAVKELAKDDDIVILPADKGRATVVMDRKDYSAKMLMMLGDRDTYQLMANDPTTSLENRMNSV